MDTEQGERPKGERLPESGAEDPVDTHEAEISRKTRLAKGVMNRSGSRSCTPPECGGGNSSIEQEPGRPGSPAPKVLESGRVHQPKKATERLPRILPQVEATIPTRKKTSQHYASKTLQAETWGAEKRKMVFCISQNTFFLILTKE